MIDERETKDQLRALFTFEQVGIYTRIRTPFLYPDGEPVDLYLTEAADQLIDIGRTKDYVATHTCQDTVVDQGKLVAELQITYGAQYKHRVFFMPVTDPSSLANAIIQLATACLVFVHVVLGQPGEG